MSCESFWCLCLTCLQFLRCLPPPPPPNISCQIFSPALSPPPLPLPPGKNPVEQMKPASKLSATNDWQCVRRVRPTTAPTFRVRVWTHVSCLCPGAAAQMPGCCDDWAESLHINACVRDITERAGWRKSISSRSDAYGTVRSRRHRSSPGQRRLSNVCVWCVHCLAPPRRYWSVNKSRVIEPGGENTGLLKVCVCVCLC